MTGLADSRPPPSAVPAPPQRPVVMAVVERAEADLCGREIQPEQRAADRVPGSPAIVTAEERRPALRPVVTLVVDHPGRVAARGSDDLADRTRPQNDLPAATAVVGSPDHRAGAAARAVEGSREPGESVPDVPEGDALRHPAVGTPRSETAGERGCRIGAAVGTNAQRRRLRPRGADDVERGGQPHAGPTPTARVGPPAG